LPQEGEGEQSCAVELALQVADLARSQLHSVEQFVDVLEAVGAQQLVAGERLDSLDNRVIAKQLVGVEHGLQTGRQLLGGDGRLAGDVVDLEEGAGHLRHGPAVVARLCQEGPQSPDPSAALRGVARGHAEGELELDLQVALDGVEAAGDRRTAISASGRTWGMSASAWRSATATRMTSASLVTPSSMARVKCESADGRRWAISAAARSRHRLPRCSAGGNSANARCRQRSARSTSPARSAVRPVWRSRSAVTTSPAGSVASRCWATVASSAPCSASSCAARAWSCERRAVGMS